MKMAAQEPADTIKQIHNLQEVEILAAPRPSAVRSTSPLQVMQGSQLEKINALQVSDVVKYFSGVQVKDYGGVGGLKTVSVRSLGANYTSVAYDGIPVADYQSGQIDLGRFSLDNVEMITLAIGESDDIFRPARVLSSAGALNIVTKRFRQQDAETYHLSASLKAGSLNLINPSLLFDKRLNEQWTVQASTEWLKTDGNYKYTQYYGYMKDSASVQRRINSDVETRKMEASLFGQFGNGGKLSVKAYYYDDDRGLPGPVIYYNSYSGERIGTRNSFVQGNYIQSLGKKLDLMTNFRFNYTYIDYVDIRATYPEGRRENEYYQREYYGNATFRYTFSPSVSFSWANDGAWGNLDNNFVDCAYPSRVTWLSALSGKYEQKRFTLTASLLSNYIDDNVQRGKDPGNHFCLSPYTGFSWRPFDQVPFRMRGFYKNTFRMPTFGDIYYSTMPNTNLKPENTNQYNIGMTWSTAWSDAIPYLNASLDAYLNRIENKIVALPGSSMFIWSVQNYGKVEIKGIDANLETHLSIGKALWRLKGVYTYQNVKDKTDNTSKMYNQQLPYAPHHSVSAYCGIETPWIDVNYTLLYCGKRYYERINRSEYLMDAYTDQGLSLTKNIESGRMKWTFSAECQNLFNVQYEVVRSYPMPGRTFRLNVRLKI